LIANREFGCRQYGWEKIFKDKNPILTEIIAGTRKITQDSFK
jgi:hypothetical protein